TNLSGEEEYTYNPNIQFPETKAPGTFQGYRRKAFVFGEIVFGIHLKVLMLLGVPISFILKFILYYKISKIQKQDKYANDELLWYKFLNQLVSFFLWFMLFALISSIFYQLAGVTMF
ncbi:MAG: hypothetical protein IJ964_02525, partial [Campylobacter sp.]|nr:hypothetical protein [Campylobacter sp.]